VCRMDFLLMRMVHSGLLVNKMCVDLFSSNINFNSGIPCDIPLQTVVAGWWLEPTLLLDIVCYIIR